MNSEPNIGPFFILITFLFVLCAVVASYCVLNGFYLSVNPSPRKLVVFLVKKWLTILIAFIPIVFIFWFTASHAAVYCRVKRESHETDTGYYFHRMSLFLPACGTVGTWSYGKQPPKSVPGLTLGTTKEHVVLHSGLAAYLLGLCFVIAWVGTYMIEEKREARRKNSN